MTHIQFDDDWHDDPVNSELSWAAHGVFLCLVSWCARHRTDGVVPAAAARRAGWPRRNLDELVMVGRLVVTETGWQIATPERHLFMEAQRERRSFGGKKGQASRKRSDGTSQNSSQNSSSNSSSNSGPTTPTPTPTPTPRYVEKSVLTDEVKEGLSKRAAPRSTEGLTAPPPGQSSPMNGSAIDDEFCGDCGLLVDPGQAQRMAMLDGKPVLFHQSCFTSLQVSRAT